MCVCVHVGGWVSIMVSTHTHPQRDIGLLVDGGLLHNHGLTCTVLLPATFLRVAACAEGSAMAFCLSWCGGVPVCVGGIVMVCVCYDVLLVWVGV